LFAVDSRKDCQLVYIHRANVLWYNRKVLADNNLPAPKTWDEFFKVADALEAIVPSVAHGAAAVEKWAAVYKDILNTFATKGDVAAASKSLQHACVDKGVCK
jgi:maltose-binding protein MalE